MKLNINEWKQFKISSLFDIETGKDFIYSEAEGDEHPVIGHGIENNGVACKSKTLDNYKLFDNKKTISMAHIGNYHSFVQISPFYLGTRTKALTAKFKSNEYIFLFITTVINKSSYKFSYGRVGSDKIPTEKILLPIEYELNDDGTFKLDSDDNKIPKIDLTHKWSDEGFIPDFKFMEDYTKSLKHQPVTTNNKKENIPKLKINEWKNFYVGKVFTCTLSKGDLKIDNLEKGTIPLVSSGKNNNGIVGNIDKNGDGQAELYSKGKLTVDMFCNVFFQNNDFYAVSHGRINILEPLFNWNSFNLLFISTIINKEKFKYSYGRAVYNSEINRMLIKLPIEYELNDDGTFKLDSDDNKIPKIDPTKKWSDDGFIPDFKFMEDYIKSLPYGDRI